MLACALTLLPWKETAWLLTIFALFFAARKIPRIYRRRMGTFIHHRTPPRRCFHSIRRLEMVLLHQFAYWSGRHYRLYFLAQGSQTGCSVARIGQEDRCVGWNYTDDRYCAHSACSRDGRETMGLVIGSAHLLSRDRAPVLPRLCVCRAQVCQGARHPNVSLQEPQFRRRRRSSILPRRCLVFSELLCGLCSNFHPQNFQLPCFTPFTSALTGLSRSNHKYSLFHPLSFSSRCGSKSFEATLQPSLVSKPCPLCLPSSFSPSAAASS